MQNDDRAERGEQDRAVARLEEIARLLNCPVSDFFGSAGDDERSEGREKPPKPQGGKD